MGDGDRSGDSRCPVLAGGESRTFWRGLRTARLPAGDRLAGASHPVHPAQPGGVLAVWLSLVALIPGVSPAGVSWIGHAGGFVAGVIAAVAVYQEPDSGLRH